MKENKLLFLIICMVAIFSSCESYDLKEDGLPSITTSVVTSASAGSASCGGNVTSDGGNGITARGVCWSTSENPTISNSKTTDGTGTGSFTSASTGLALNTTFYVRAYATNSAGTVYGDQYCFVIDIDGNYYNTVKIGTQEWMVQNLKTTKYRNGNAIPNITDRVQWVNLSTGAYCNYNNDANNANVYGRLYNLHAVNDERNIAPTGWRVPKRNDWLVLIQYAGLSSWKLKGGSDWYGSNDLGFTALPGGYRENGYFNFLGALGNWWTSTKYSISSAYYIGMNKSDVIYYDEYHEAYYGMSIRCVKD